MSTRFDKHNKPMIKQRIKRSVRFPDDEEIEEFLEEAIPMAEKKAAAEI